MIFKRRLGTKFDHLDNSTTRWHSDRRNQQGQVMAHYPSNDIRSVLNSQAAAQMSTYANVHSLNAHQQRSPEQIQAEIDARVAELRAEAAKPERRFPCRTCDWCASGYRNACNNPLLTGIAGHLVDNWDSGSALVPRLCGPEKALWEQRRSWWQRLIDWLVEVMEP